MLDFLQPFYLWIQAGHVIAMVAWMAGIFYLPRLFVYHVEGLAKAGVTRGSDMDLLFQHQERLLLRAIMNPAMIATWVLGLILVFLSGAWSDGWLHVKFAGVLALTWFHMWLAARRRDFVEGSNTRSGRSYRIMNEVPTLLLFVIVVMVIVKPF
jgi:putative membrane protein